MVTYVPGTEEADHKKQNMSLQQIGPKLDTAITNIATNTTNIATNTTNITTLQAQTAGYEAVWTTYSTAPTFGGLGAGTLAGSYLQIGKTMHLNVNVTMSATGTSINIPLPNSKTPVATGVIMGMETAATNKLLTGRLIASSNLILILDGTISYVPTNGHVINMTGVFQVN